MVKSQENKDFEQVIEKIVFDEEELEELKVTIRKFVEGQLQAKQLKQKLLESRGRMVKEISNFLSFCIDRVRNSDQAPECKVSNNSNKLDLDFTQLRQKIEEKNELLKTVAEKINNLVIKVKK